jgi:uncharacterized protein (TIGR00369 family)
MTVRSRTVSWDDPVAAARLSAGMSGLDYLQAIADGELPAAPIANLMGFEIEHVEAGRVVFAALPSEYHYNPIGMVHGGLAATLLDSAMGCAVHSLLPPRRFYTTLEIKINFVRALTRETGQVRAVGTVVHHGRNTATAEGRVLDQRDKIYAHGSTTCLLSER